MHPYQVTPSAGLIKLDAMENPYGWPDELKRLWLSEIENTNINRYPDPDAASLKSSLRKVMHINNNLDIMLGNGSDELIQIIALATAQPGSTLMTPEPGFVMYRLISQAVNIQYYPVPLNENDYSLEGDIVLTAIKEIQPTLIFIAYPNNPTGNLFDQDLILDVIKTTTGLVIIDEAYHAFSGKSFIRFLEDFENLLVLRTMSKSGLAGLRLGYLIGANEWIQELEKIRLPYNINSLTQKTAEFILDHYEVMEQQAKKIYDSREQLYASLCSIDGIQAWPSQANFLLFRITGMNSTEVYNELRRKGVLIKNLGDSHKLLRGCLRVTVGTEEENNEFLKKLRSLL